MSSELKFIEKATNAVADNLRLKILLELSQQGEMSCGEIQALIGVSQPTCSHHLKLLSDSELIVCRKEGKFHKFSLNKTSFSQLSLFFQELS
ncbi:ArsR/SmtB family transcription factor [Flectobacillus major]|jgi:DNA-binding transcriptional ArsR family regulator|uniref:ArsR/SmtB family transcription factor n=1 Tax=Flectobacillus major TaxID=103 RepID=UPI00040F1BEA|nr:metalloregulator ArsR/SmtB family transcription factor [Flectobacillus major]